jgi:hypothetical protein
MPNKNTAPHRLSRMLGLAAAGVAALALAGPAQAACTQPSTTKAFTAFGDSADYFLAPDGGFEGYASGWLKSNAAIVNDNESWRVAGGSKGLKLNGGGASATSPGFCIDLNNPSIRLFTKSTATGGVDSSYLMIEALITSQIGTTSTILGTVSSHYSWAATQVLDLRGAANAHLHSGLSSNTSATLKLRFTVMNGGASYTIDDVEVDPFRGG